MDTELRVAIRRCSVYDRSAVAEIVDDISQLSGFSKGYHGQTVLLKPNLISGGGPVLACTHGEFIAGVASWFIDHGARVILGDSPAFGSGATVCEKQGISKAVANMDVQLVEFTTPVRKKLAGGVSVQIAREALECDLFVGLPKIKAHNQMYVTMAVKNIFGIVKGVNKALLHMVHGNSHDHFGGIILDLLSLLPAQLHLADAIEVMHISGPLDGEPLSLNCIAAASSPVALDTAMLNLLELDAVQCPLWRVASARGLAGSRFIDIIFTALQPADFFGSGFNAPSSLNAIRFNPFRFMLGIMRRVTLAIRH